ncbi:AAA family ATPase [Actinokineospora globicatena]|uniref:AAA family ATPase n=1 Tax=Actinokineospora globicatena TaxID=103729 RepID=UPI0020A526BD|nr:AAA family ATPase [Actinokineospora globicatena]GLW80538.1 hypothetical protein Aglo01_50190 [Actinokineospora globicatena]GLW87366.1 hypothetical protein Aglo02_50050 [Actinokineospora globicatena]
MAVILVTGMSGTGKSTVLDRLGRLGYRVVDTDYDGWTIPGAEPLWDEERVDALITAHESSGEPLFLAGTVRNQDRFRDRFTDVVLLTAPLPVLLERVATRDTNDFGKDPAERDRIVADTAAVEPLLRASATVEIDTRAPLAEVVDRLAALAARRAPR